MGIKEPPGVGSRFAGDLEEARCVVPRCVVPARPTISTWDRNAMRELPSVGEQIEGEDRNFGDANTAQKNRRDEVGCSAQVSEK